MRKPRSYCEFNDDGTLSTLSDLKKSLDTWTSKVDDGYGEFCTEPIEAIVASGGKLKADLSKVGFSFENRTSDEHWCGYPTGYHSIGNFHFLGCAAAGGDWETPVFFIVYWDGKNIRGYIPSEGNLWNHMTKLAYGNDMEYTARMSSTKNYIPGKRDVDDWNKRTNEDIEFESEIGDCDQQLIIDDIVARFGLPTNVMI